MKFGNIFFYDLYLILGIFPNFYFIFLNPLWKMLFLFSPNVLFYIAEAPDRREKNPTIEILQ